VQWVEALCCQPVGPGVIRIFHWRNPSGRTMALSSTQKREPGILPRSKGGRRLGLTLPPSCVNCPEIWETQPLVQACKCYCFSLPKQLIQLCLKKPTTYVKGQSCECDFVANSKCGCVAAQKIWNHFHTAIQNSEWMLFPSGPHTLKVYVRSSIHSLRHYQSRYDGCKACRSLQWTSLIFTVNVVKRKYTVIIKYDHSHRLFFTFFFL